MKALFAGVGAAAVAGMLMGAAMKPNLAGDDRPAGPQILAGWSGARSTGPFDPGMSFADYQGNIPDYVVGTDWKSAAAFSFREDVAYEPAETPDYYQEAKREPAQYAETRYEEPPRAAPVYPSMSGGVAHDVLARVPDAAPQPVPTSEPVELDDEAPPEATGDTTPLAS